MKKFLLIASVSVVALASKAQSDVHLGLKAGVNVASMKVENGSDYDSRASFNVGGLAHIHVTKHFALQPELVVSGQGGKYDVTNNTKGEVKLTYLNVPVLGQYMVGDGFRLETGPQLGFLLGAKSNVNKVTVDVKDSYKTADFAWAFGAGYISDIGLGVDVRYNLGLSNIWDGTSNNMQNRVLQLGLFYQFMNSKR